MAWMISIDKLAAAMNDPADCFLNLRALTLFVNTQCACKRAFLRVAILASPAIMKRVARLFIFQTCKSTTSAYGT